MAEATAIANEVEQDEAAGTLGPTGSQQGQQKTAMQAWSTEELRTLYEVAHNAELLAQEWQLNGMSAAELAERVVQLKEQAGTIEAKLSSTQA